jgi:hypothetical protein
MGIGADPPIRRDVGSAFTQRGIEEDLCAKSIGWVHIGEEERAVNGEVLLGYSENFLRVRCAVSD